MIKIFIILILLLLIFYLFFNINFNVIENFKSNDLKIDVVYTWVDGHDINWKNKKEKYIKNTNTKDKILHENINELKYSIRSLNKYASWINNIYIVADDDQIPSFINFNNEKIKLVKHSDIIDKKYLPTFNSLVIEANIHHIKGLSETFLYFNDDFFLGNNLYKKDINNSIYGKYKKFNGLNKKDNAYYSCLKINHLILKKIYPDIKYFNPWHHFYLCKKSLMYELEDLFKNEFHETCTHKFRKSNNNKNSISRDLWMIGLQQSYGLYKKIYIFKKFNKSIKMYVDGSKKLDLKKLDIINKKRSKYFCLNNIHEKYRNNYLNFLEKYYNFKSEYEN